MERMSAIESMSMVEICGTNRIKCGECCREAPLRLPLAKVDEGGLRVLGPRGRGFGTRMAGFRSSPSFILTTLLLFLARKEIEHSPVATPGSQTVSTTAVVVGNAATEPVTPFGTILQGSCTRLHYALLPPR